MLIIVMCLVQCCLQSDFTATSCPGSSIKNVFSPCSKFVSLPAQIVPTNSYLNKAQSKRTAGIICRSCGVSAASSVVHVGSLPPWEMEGATQRRVAGAVSCSRVQPNRRLGTVVCHVRMRLFSLIPPLCVVIRRSLIVWSSLA